MFDLSYLLERLAFIATYIPVTMALALLAMVTGTFVGTLIAIIRHNKIPFIDQILAIYVSFFRGTPLIVQLFLFYFGLPQLIPSVSTTTAITMSVIVLSINASAYISETVRAAINSVDQDQMEAAISIGMSKVKAMLRIILPQATRIAIPPLSNTFISLIQGTAITFTIGVTEMMGIAKIGAAASYKFLESYLAVGLLYWMITYVSAKLLHLLEKRLARAY
ncbi:amino acid ABC transporter permease [Vallitalea okinawensis]|uniref:amino acid ABC transporter permease n=1 Tax=Vallitalea okinawensis TaxID=2078660 RepID=UPI000CFD3BC7|nr:amino acid ABC transporter permease [Vallitalea okinawensis]